MNTVEHVCLLHIGASSGYMPRSGIAGSLGNTMSNFLPAAGHPGAKGGEQGDLLCPHPQQHGGGSAADADCFPGEQPPGGWQCCGAGGPAALYGGTGGAGAG